MEAKNLEFDFENTTTTSFDDITLQAPKPHILHLMLNTTHPVQPVNQPLDILKALANDVRFEIVSILAQRECCVCDLEAVLDLNQSKVSYHLAVLRDAGLISGEQRGKNSFYRLEHVPLYRLGGELLEALLKPRADITLTDQLNSMC